MKITVDLLHEHKACSDQVSLFEQTFPDGCDLTPETWEHAIQVGLDVMWCERLLAPAARKQYEAVVRPAREQYEAVERPAWEQYQAVERPAWEQYEAVERQAWEQYKAVESPALEQYKAVERPACEQYEAVVRPAREQYEAVERQALLEALMTHAAIGEAENAHVPD